MLNNAENKRKYMGSPVFSAFRKIFIFYLQLEKPAMKGKIKTCRKELRIY